MKKHAGELAFWGGMREEGEESAQETAFREFAEETQISSTALNFQGYLPAVRSSMNNIIIPVVSTLTLGRDEFLRDCKSNGEWERCLSVDCDQFSQTHEWVWGNWCYSSEKDSSAIYFYPFDYENEFQLLWGATAKIVYQARDVLRDFDL